MIYVKDMTRTRKRGVLPDFKVSAVQDPARDVIVIRATARMGEVVVAEVVHEVEFEWLDERRLWRGSRRISDTGSGLALARCEAMADDWTWLALFGALNAHLPARGAVGEVA